MPTVISGDPLALILLHVRSPPPICQYVNKKKERLFPQNFCGVKSGNYLSMFLFTIFSLWFYKPQESETWQPNLVLHDCFL